MCPDICPCRERLKALRRKAALFGLVASLVLLSAPRFIEDSERVELRVLSGKPVHHAHDPNRTPTPSEAMLACIRQWETGGGKNPDGNYAAVSKSGTYRGAYQFDQPTWNEAARTSIHHDWIGRRPESAPHEIQDSMASHLYRQRGLDPWPTPSRKCRGR